MGLRLFVCGRAPACARSCVREYPRVLSLPRISPLSLSLSLCTLSSAELGWASITNLMVGFIAKIRSNSFGRPIYLTKKKKHSKEIRFPINNILDIFHTANVFLFCFFVCLFFHNVNVGPSVSFIPLRSINAIWGLKGFSEILFSITDLQGFF